MSKYLMLFTVLFGMVACNATSRKAESDAYAAGCTAGINVVLESLGAAPNVDKIAAFCNNGGAEYVKTPAKK